MDVHTQFVQEEPTTGYSMFAHDLGQLCRGRRIHTSGHSDLRILSNLGPSSNFTWVYADTASAACPSQAGNLAMTSITFAAVICDADEKDCIGSRVVLYNRLLQYHLGARLCLGTSGIWVPAPHVWSDRCPSMWQSGLSLCLSVLQE